MVLKMREKWGWKKLKDICLNKGEYGSGARKVEYDGKVRYIRITDIDDDGKLRNDEVVSPSIIEEKYFLEKDDLLFARSGSVGRTYLHQEDKGRYQYAGYLIRFKIDKTKAIPKYIYFFTKSSQYHSWVNKTRRSGTLSNINAKEYSNLLIPLPPLPIQKRIVSILEKAEKLKERRKKANEETNKIIQSIFYEMFGEKDKFEIVELGDKRICENIFAGGDVPKNNFSREKTDQYKIPIFTNGEKNKGLYGYTDKARVSKPSITISARGTIGYTEIRKENFYPAIRLIVITPKENVLNLYYLKSVIDNLINFNLSGTSIHQLTVPMIKRYKIPVPQIHLQLKFASIVKKIESMKERQKKSTEDINQLFDALMQKAFKGELVQ